MGEKNCSNLNQTFNTIEDLLKAKSNYEELNNIVLTIKNSHLHSDENLKARLLYSRATFICKAGEVRPSESMGLRASNTGRLGCPFFFQVGMEKGILKIKKINVNHENHNQDIATFQCYSENLRLKDYEKQMVSELIECGANKVKVKAKLMEKRGGAPVMLKSLHNLQTALFKDEKGENELKTMINEMKKIPNATIRVAVNENNEFLSVYFQDARMKEIFHYYPELVIFDATYKLNNRRIPLFIWLAIDGKTFLLIIF